MIADPNTVEWLEDLFEAASKPGYPNPARKQYFALFQPQVHRSLMDIFEDLQPLSTSGSYRHGLPICMACYDDSGDDSISPCDFFYAFWCSHLITDGGVQWIIMDEWG